MRADKIGYLKGTAEFDLPFSRGLCTNVREFFLQDGFLSDTLGVGPPWAPTVYKPYPRIVRDSEDWVNNIWENKYWSCC